jgi:hypothetical protein
LKVVAFLILDGSVEAAVRAGKQTVGKTAFDLALAKRAGNPPAVPPGVPTPVGTGKSQLLGGRTYT